jgi:hypothetical protein
LYSTHSPGDGLGLTGGPTSGVGGGGDEDGTRGGGEEEEGSGVEEHCCWWLLGMKVFVEERVNENGQERMRIRIRGGDEEEDGEFKITREENVKRRKERSERSER